jgi:hypothetical protein
MLKQENGARNPPNWALPGHFATLEGPYWGDMSAHLESILEVIFLTLNL